MFSFLCVLKCFIFLGISRSFVGKGCLVCFFGFLWCLEFWGRFVSGVGFEVALDHVDYDHEAKTPTSIRLTLKDMPF